MWKAAHGVANIRSVLLKMRIFLRVRSLSQNTTIDVRSCRIISSRCFSHPDTGNMFVVCVDISEKIRKTMLEMTNELSSDCTLKDKLQKELNNSKEVIRSTEKACDTLRKLASDKDEIIAQQKIIIDSCRCRSKDYNEELTNLCKKLEEANNLIDERNFELHETKELLVEKKSEVNGNRKLEKELATSLLLNGDLRNELRTQVIITKKTGLAFNTHTELVQTKEELIKKQRIVIEHMKRAQEENTNLIGATSNKTEHPSVPGFQESVLCMALY